MKKLGPILITALVLVTGAYLRLRDSRIQNVAAKKMSMANVPAMKKTTKQDKLQNKTGTDLQSGLTEADIDKDKILFTSDGEAALRVLHRTIHEYYADNEVEAIVEGVISNIKYTHINSSIFTILTVDVLHTFKGRTEKTIVVFEEGGYAKFKDMLDVFEGHIDMSKLTTDQIENGIVEDRMFGAPHSKRSQQVVLFLLKNPYLGSAPTRTYQVVSSVYGKLTLDKDTGAYKRFELDDKDDPQDKTALSVRDAVSFETSVPKADLASKFKSDN